MFIKNGSLFFKANSQNFRLFPESKTRFYVQGTTINLDFILDSNDKILKVIVPSHNETWKRLN